MSACGQRPDIVILPDPVALAEEAARRFVAAAAQAVSVRGHFTVALAGGSTPVALYRLLSRPPYGEQIAWERTLIFFGDERCVPPDHPWSNYQMARAALLDHVPLPGQNVYRIAGERPPTAAANDYAAVLRRVFRLRGAARPQFDLILLGMGEDGHTASLFPGMPAMFERRRLAVVTPVPEYVQPAVARITLTLPVLNAARQVMFLVAGANKAEKVQVVLASTSRGRTDRGQFRADGHAAGGQALPAGQVRPPTGMLIWLLDRAAATELVREREEGFHDGQTR
ncbi:MAG: 6-phosphogluconolactonase [Anaerolineae bacterium]